MKANNFYLIAHRGYSSKAPENTLTSFWLAIKSGFPQIELDVELTKDNIPVIFHDEMMDRTTNSTGKISDHRLKEIAELDDGSWFNDKFTNVKVPTLKQVLAEIGNQSHLHIELKSSEAVLPKLVAQELEHASLLHHTMSSFDVPGLTITSFSIDQLARSIDLSPQVQHSWLVDEIDDQVIKRANEVGIKQLCPKASNVIKNSVTKAVESGFSVRGWGVETEDDVIRLYKAGAHGATVNWPDKAKETLSSYFSE